MDDKRKISGIRKDLSLSEISKNLYGSKKIEAKKTSFFRKSINVLKTFGLLPTLNSSSKTGGGSASYSNSSNTFREGYRVHPQRQRTHEDWEKEQVARATYMSHVDGKGDHDCGHEH